MKKVLFVLGSLTLLFSVVNGQVSSTNNVLNSTGVTAIQSITSGYKLSVGGAVKQFGTGTTGTGSPTLYLRNTTASTGRNFGINSSDGGLFQVFDSNASNAIRFVINSSGYMGINTTSPAYHLDVNGSIKSTGNIYLPASTSTTGIVYVGSSPFMHAVGTNSVFLGKDAGKLTNTGSNNTGIGNSALTSITTGNSNTAVGNNAMNANTGGAYNTAVGEASLRQNTTGNYNTALGVQALEDNLTGSGNTAIGESTLSANTTGDDNVAIGTDVLLNNRTGSRNIAVGRLALDANISGNDNTAIGLYALRKVTSSHNTAMGDSAGTSVSTGTGNAFFGKLSGSSIQTGSNNSFFGYNINNSGTGNLTGSNNTAIGSNITGMGTGNYNTVIGSGLTVPAVNNNILLADGQGNQRIRIFDTGNTLIGYAAFADSGYKLDVNGSIRSMGAVRFQGLTTNNALTNILASDASGNISWRDASTLGGSGPNLNNWSITGNSGTNPSANFIGTTDSINLVLRTNNKQRASIFANGTFNIGANDTASRPVFQVYPNGDFAVNATNDYTANKYNNKNGIRYNKKLGLLEIGVSNNIDTSLINTTQGTYEKSGLIVNSDSHNTIQGSMTTSIMSTDNTTLSSTGSLSWSMINGESHNISGWVNKSHVLGWGMNVSAELGNSMILGQAHTISKRVTESFVGGYGNTALDTTTSSIISGAGNNFSGNSSLVSGFNLISKNWCAATIGSGNVDLSSLPLVKVNKPANLQNYPLLIAANSSDQSGVIRSNALTMLYSGRTQINTTGYNTNLTETDVTPKAALEIVSNNSGILIPKLTTTQRDNIVSGDLQNGLLLYNTTSTQFQFYNGSSWKALSDSSAAGVTASGIGAWSMTGNTGINPSSAFIGTTDLQPVIFKTNNTETMRIGANGNIGIGTSSINDPYKLSVSGDIRARKVKVNQDSWSDYVFDNDYRLPTLTEVQQYINQHKHLPDVPSAKEVEKNGLDLGGNQAVLLRKIEELTLYAIEQNKQIENQDKRIEQQQQQIDELIKLAKKK